MKKYHPGKVPPFTSEGLKSFLSPPPTTYANIVDLVGASSLWLCLSRAISLLLFSLLITTTVIG